MKFAFVTDLHGVPGLWRRLRAFCQAERPDALLCGGDMLPDGKRPRPQEEPLRFIREFLEPFLVELRAALPDLRILTIAGNHDWELAVAGLEPLRERGLLELPSAGRPVGVGDVRVFGYAGTPPTPFWVKDYERLDSPDAQVEFPARRSFVSRGAEIVEIDPAETFVGRPSIAEELDAAAAGGDVADSVWLIHSPPHGTFADMMYGPQHVGSRAIREFIERRRPRITLHGHIHEAPAMSGTFADVIGSTLVVNPGRTYDGLDAAVFDPADAARTLRHSRLGMWRE